MQQKKVMVMIGMLNLKNLRLKRLLQRSFPNKKIVITDNKDGAQTILIT